MQQPIWRHGRRGVPARLSNEPIQASAPRPSIRLLNAARRQGLAARTRTYLVNRGWRRIEIGDATVVRERSVVLYSAGRQKLGQSLAAQFGFASRKLAHGDALIRPSWARRKGQDDPAEAGMIASLLLAAATLRRAGRSADAFRRGPGDRCRAARSGPDDDRQGRCRGASGAQIDRLLADLAFASGKDEEALARS